MDVFGIIVICLASLCNSVAAGDPGCTARTSVNEMDYALGQLNRLHSLFGERFSNKTDAMRFEIVVCGDVSQDPKYKNVTIALISDGNIVHPLGYRTAVRVIGGDHWVMVMFLPEEPLVNNTNCSGNVKSSVMFLCNRNEAQGTFVKLHYNSEECSYAFELQHKKVCGSIEEGMSGASIFFLILFVSLLCYFLFGFLYRRFMIGAKGVEQIPNRHFWIKVGNGIADCVGALCRCDRYCGDTVLSAGSPHSDYSPIGENRPISSQTYDRDAPLINP